MDGDGVGPRRGKVTKAFSQRNLDIIHCRFPPLLSVSTILRFLR
jgi:hypothetical protein